MLDGPTPAGSGVGCHGGAPSPGGAVVGQVPERALAAERRPRRAPEAMSAIPNSWKPSRRDGSSSLYYLIGDFVSQEINFVRLIKVFVAIAHRGASLPGRREAALTKINASRG